MSGAATIAAVAAVASVGVAVYSGMEQKKAAGRAADQAGKAADQQAAQAEQQAQIAEKQVAAAEEQTKKADQANNSANQKKPNANAALDASQQAGKSGASGTMLTGPMGVDPGALQLGKNTLLGQ